MIRAIGLFISRLLSLNLSEKSINQTRNDQYRDIGESTTLEEKANTKKFMEELDLVIMNVKNKRNFSAN